MIVSASFDLRRHGAERVRVVAANIMSVVPMRRK
jgi:hypothetical protein